MRGFAFVVLVGCGRVDFDVRADTSVPLGPWSQPTLVAELASVSEDDDPTLTGDMLEIYFNSWRGPDPEIWVATRNNLTDPFGPPTVLPELSSIYEETTPEISSDGMTLFFSASRADSIGNMDIYTTTRATRGDVWGVPVRVPELCSTSNDESPSLDANGTTIYLDSERVSTMGIDNILSATRPDRATMWSVPAVVLDLDGPDEEENPFLETNGLTMWLTVRGTTGDYDIFYATRPSIDSPFGPAQRADELDTSTDDLDAWVSPDSRTIYFASNRDGNFEIYRATR